MRIVSSLVLTATLFYPDVTASAQSWNSGKSVGAVTVEWSEKDTLYTFTLSSPAGAITPVVAWSLVPFNVPEPVSVVCPDGWTWRVSGGWKFFSLTNDAQKYVVGGPGVEPGESATFLYQVGPITEPVNRGGPDDGRVAFTSHVGAVGEALSGKWAPVRTELGPTWTDRCRAVEFFSAVPEPASLGAVAFGFSGFACLSRRRKRV